MRRSPSYICARQSHEKGATESPEYRSWRGARARCLNPNEPCYAGYGARGIKMCAAWVESFAQFLADMGPRPVGTTLDRIDVNGDYEPTNCRWATYSQQSKNTRRALFVEIDGEKRHILDAAAPLGLSVKGMIARRYRGVRGDALSAPKFDKSAPRKITPDIVARILAKPNLSAKKLGPLLGISHMSVNRVRRGIAGKPLHVPQERQ